MTISKSAAVLLIVIISALLAGVYGILHDQVSYSVSPEYYTKFKFDMFRMLEVLPGHESGSGKNPEILLNQPRIGAALVGLASTWWVGAIAGVLLAFLFRKEDARQMIRMAFRGLMMMLVSAVIFAGIGLLAGQWLFSENSFYLPDHVIDRQAFVAVGSMHNFSYIGGFIGIIIASYYCVKYKRI